MSGCNLNQSIPEFEGVYTVGGDEMVAQRKWDMETHRASLNIDGAPDLTSLPEFMVKYADSDKLNTSKVIVPLYNLRMFVLVAYRNRHHLSECKDKDLWTESPHGHATVREVLVSSTVDTKRVVSSVELEPGYYALFVGGKYGMYFVFSVNLDHFDSSSITRELWAGFTKEKGLYRFGEYLNRYPGACPNRITR